MSEAKKFKRWPLAFIAAPASVAVWSGWVGLGALCGFGIIHPFPGIPWVGSFKLNTAITLPIGVEAYGAYAMGAWLTPGMAANVKRFAKRSAIGSLAFGMLGQVAYHLLAAAHRAHAPWPIVVLVACLPVIALGFGAALAHLLRGDAESAAKVPSIAPDASVPAEDERPAEAVTGPSRAIGAKEPKVQLTGRMVMEGVDQEFYGHPETKPAPRPTTSHRQRARHAPGAPTVEAVEREFADEISRGEIPKLPTIRRRLRVGDAKARSYQNHIAEKGRAVRDARAAA